MTAAIPQVPVPVTARDYIRPVNFEYLTADSKMVINQETSFEVAGGWSRHFKPASFKLICTWGQERCVFMPSSEGILFVQHERILIGERP